MKINAIIVDDQQDAIDDLQCELTKNCPEIHVLATCKTIEDAFQKINSHKPNLVFLDIDLGTHTSFELLNLFNPVLFKIIFVTGHNDFAIKAIKYSALDYIIKPVHSLELLQAIEKVKSSHMNETNYNLLKDQINQKKLLGKIALNLGEKIEVVNIQDIIHIKSDEPYCHVYTTNDKKHFTSSSLKDFESILSDYNFYRCHKSHLININHIQSYAQKDNYDISMANGEQIPLAIRKRSHFLEMMKPLLPK